MRKLTMNLCSMMLSAVCAASCLMPVIVAPSDIIDTSRSASVTIHKYDMTAATNDGIDIYQYTANGKKDTGAEATLREHQMN